MQAIEKDIVGLTTERVVDLLSTYGPNVLPEAERPGLLSIYISQFKSPFIYVLLIAAIVSFALGQTLNGIFIFVVLLLNALIGTMQEYAAEQAASALEKMVPYRSTVLRDNKQILIDTAEIVPGDIVILVSGDKIPADMHFINTHDLQVDESMLTGESVASNKDAKATSEEIDSPAERLDMGYAGTIVLRGRAQGKVVATGIKTEIGKIAVDVASDEQVKPPLLLRIEKFTLRITYGILLIISLIFLITLLRGDDVVTVFFLGVALAVSAIPEGLPVAITVALAIGMKRMANNGVIIRRLVAVESLGSCTYIASDKTGTLTVNEMTIRKMVLVDGSHYEVSGEGMDLHGSVTPPISGENDNRMADLLLYAGLLANEATLDCVDSEWIGQGDRVDVSLIVFAEKAGVDVASTRKRCTQLASIPYESHNAYAASINRVDGVVELFVKGSVEKITSMANSGDADVASQIKQMIGNAESMARDGFRVIALAHRRLEEVPDDPANVMSDLDLLGIVGMIDPLRPEVIGAVQQCRDAQIKVAMITGDHPETARALARELGISRQGISREFDDTLTGAQLRELQQRSESEYLNKVYKARVFARVEPHQKKEIIDVMKRHHEFVAVTGDGVNDAPALSHAHVGISMGLRGSDVARESSDIILTDDNFASIVQGVKQGRIVYNNIRKVVFLLISTGAAEITLIILSILFGMPLPLMPIQLLWLNLVTNGIQDVALVFEPEEGHELLRPPRSPDEPIFNRLMIERVLLNALVMGVLAFCVFYWQMMQGVEVETARNITLLLMVLFENVHVFNSRSETLSIFRQYFFGNPLLLFGMLAAQAIHIGSMYMPGLNTVLMVEPVTLIQWGQLLSIAIVLIFVDELHKYWHQSRVKN